MKAQLLAKIYFKKDSDTISFKEENERNRKQMNSLKELGFKGELKSGNSILETGIESDSEYWFSKTMEFENQSEIYDFQYKHMITNLCVAIMK